MALVIHCADIGSVARRKFGWARIAAEEPGAICTTGRDIAEFADGIAADLNAGAQVAVGFECPLFIPVSEAPAELTSARPGEGNRAWSAAAGAASLSTGLSETTWILERVRRKVSKVPPVFVDWAPFRRSSGGLFVWEAFVTKEAKADSDHGDAEIAVLSFRDSLPEPDVHNAIKCTCRVRSLIGAALLQTGLVTEADWLEKPCLVIRA